MGDRHFLLMTKSLPYRVKKFWRKSVLTAVVPTLQAEENTEVFQSSKTPFPAKTVLFFIDFSVCGTRRSDYWSTGWIPSCLEQTQGIICPRPDYYLLFGLISNPDICKYFTRSSAFLTGNFLQMTSWRESIFFNTDWGSQIKSLACFLYALETCICNEHKQYLPLGNVLWNNRIAIQQNPNMPQVTNDAAAAKSASRDAPTLHTWFTSHCPNLHV